MEIAQVPGATALSPPVSPVSENAATQISSDFEVFLQMLTAQMQYQDPLNPIDSTDYATQLATFSGVEQAVLTNDLLEQLTAQMTLGGLSEMASWVGRDARSSAPVFFEGQPVELFPQSVGAAESYEIVVRDAAGAEVQTIAFAPGRESVTWAGVQPNGTPFAQGVYSFQVVGKTGDEVVSQAGVYAYSTVSEVRVDGGQTVVVMGGGVTVPSAQVTALRDAGD